MKYFQKWLNLSQLSSADPELTQDSQIVSKYCEAEDDILHANSHQSLYGGWFQASSKLLVDLHFI